MNPTTGTPELLTQAQAVRLGGVSRWTIQRDVRAGRLTVHTVPGHPRLRRYRREDVERLYLNHKEKP